MGQTRSRRRFLGDLVFLGGGLLAASIFVAKASNGAPEHQISAEHFPRIRSLDELYSNADTFAGLPVVDYEPKKPAKATACYRFRSEWDGKDVIPELKHFLATPAALETTALVLGAWHGEDPEKTSAEVVSTLVGQAERLPKLRAIFVGDIMSEELEISWIQQSDLSSILTAFPNLELLRTRGGCGLALSQPHHQNLRALAMESGGLPSELVQSLMIARLPNLEYLELWLGTEDYGGDATVQDLQPLLEGRLFPKLKHLGLRDSCIADKVAQALVEAPIVDQLETLDLSLGTLTDAGGKALLKLKSRNLKHLDLYHHYLSPQTLAQIKKLPLTVNASNPEYMETNPEDYYVAVGE